jgi:hypothetical protein
MIKIAFKICPTRGRRIYKKALWKTEFSTVHEKESFWSLQVNDFVIFTGENRWAKVLLFLIVAKA